ncbi:MAG: glycosyltransferase family 4 protein [Planctomycetales bacterium]|nr:glycosyltransferase family 4 protein [Planctomycetales bacterium]
MRIAWISYDFGEYCVRQAAALADQHQVLLALDAEELDASRDKAGDAELYAIEPARLREPMKQAKCIKRLVSRVESFRPDVVHIQHGRLWFNLLGIPRLREYPLVVTVHDVRRHSGDRLSRKTPQWVMDRGPQMADRVIVHGGKLKQEAVKQLGLPLDRIDVVPHVAIGLPEKAPESIEDPDTILFFGRIWPYKGLRYLLEAAPLVAQRFPNARFVVAGQGEDIAAYRSLVLEGVRVDFINRWIDDRERSRLFSECAMAALPYTEATQSGVTPVAYAHGKPVVATDVGALSECVRHGETGLLVPPRDPAALADAIVSLLADPERRHDLGAAGRRLVDTEWSPEAVAAKTLRCYERAIASRAVSAARRTPRPTVFSSKAL